MLPSVSRMSSSGDPRAARLQARLQTRINNRPGFDALRERIHPAASSGEDGVSESAWLGQHWN